MKKKDKKKEKCTLYLNDVPIANFDMSQQTNAESEKLLNRSSKVSEKVHKEVNWKLS